MPPLTFQILEVSKWQHLTLLACQNILMNLGAICSLNQLISLAVNETRLDCSISNTASGIPGYSLERKDCNRNGEGVAIYIRNSVNYESMPTLYEKLELLCVKVIKPMAKPFIVGTWYRPPGSTNEIMHAFGTALERLEQHNLETNILGDFNCDIAAIPLDHQTIKFLDICNLYQFHQFKVLCE